MLPNLPQRRRAKPKAFARPSVSLDHHGRSWVDAWPVAKLEINDVVMGKGLVTQVKIRETGVTVVFVSETVFYPVDETVKAFVAGS